MTARMGVNIVVVLNKGYDKVISRYITVKGQTPTSRPFALCSEKLLITASI